MKKLFIASAIGFLSINAFATEYQTTNVSKRIIAPEIQHKVYFKNTKTNQMMDVYYHNGKHYLAGNFGDTYAIQICNKSRYNPQRQLYVVSVDGLNVISGEQAGFNQKGYVVSPDKPCATIKGWRKNMKEEAQFVLTNPSNSYSARINEGTDNLGVIGIAVFPEKQEEIVNQMAAPIPGAVMEQQDAGATIRNKSLSSSEPSMAKAEKLGTGHGEKVWSTATNTQFTRASDQPSQVLTFYYDSYQNLIDKGIIPQKNPRPFPQEGFAKDPLR